MAIKTTNKRDSRTDPHPRSGRKGQPKDLMDPSGNRTVEAVHDRLLGSVSKGTVGWRDGQLWLAVDPAMIQERVCA